MSSNPMHTMHGDLEVAQARRMTVATDLASALTKLHEAGWTAREVFASATIVQRARELMDGLHLFEVCSHHLRTAAEAEGHFAAKEVRAWRAERHTWKLRLEALDGDALLRRALWIVGEELHLGSTEARLGVERLDGVH